MEKIKTLLADDSALIRRAISRVITSDQRFDEPDTASDGVEAVRILNEKKYDVVVLDIEMPKQDGIETLKKIMAMEVPVPVVMFSSLTQKNTTTSVQCLELGAIDVVGKPSQVLGTSLDVLKDELLQKLYNASKVPTSKLKQLAKISGTLGKHETGEVRVIHKTPEKYTAEAVLIGISTGGPQTLQSLLTMMPENLNVGVVIAQHMPKGFTKPMAERLDKYCCFDVKEAEDGDLIKPGRIIIGKAGDHITFNKRGEHYSISLTRQPPKLYYPSVDVMFESASSVFTQKVVAVVMTGMGNDGTMGARPLKNKGKHTIIAQDEESSVIYGMPKSIVENKLADKISSLDDMIKTIIESL
ncbi:MAG: chemotaxis-specific protein-glutamate methyltransferase CheB [Nitrospinae bacterium]|nr:chemotaxis-specific protein-glutamate methyltransferase CheB [Nitrospinota bacterium]